MAIIKSTYKDQVVEHIYNLILDGELNPGNQLKESWLSKEMGISRAPIREALKELISNGIVDYKPQIGNFIAHLSPKETVDAYITRGVLEGYAIMDTCNQFTEDEIELLESKTVIMKKCADNNQHKRIINLGGEFHDLLISKNKNIQLIEYTERLSLKLHVLFYKHWSLLYSADEIGARHQKIVTSLRTSDPIAIEKVIREHYAETGTKIAALQNNS